MTDDDLRLLTTEEVAALRAMTPRAVAQERADGRGPRYVKLGRQVRYRPADLVAYVEAHVVTPGKAS